MLRRLLFVAFWSILKGLITAQLKNSLRDVGVKAPQFAGQSLNMGNGLVMLQKQTLNIALLSDFL